MLSTWQTSDDAHMVQQQQGCSLLEGNPEAFNEMVMSFKEI